MSVSIQLSAQSPLSLSADVLVVAVSPGPLVKQEPLASLDKALSGALAKLIAREEFKGEKDQQLDAPALGALPFAKVVLLGTGAKGQVSNADLRTLSAKAARLGNGAKAKSLALVFADNLAAEKLRFVTEGLILGAYRFNKYFTGDRKPKAEIATITIGLGSKTKIARPHKAAVELGQAVAAAVSLTRDLVNEPPNELYPAKLASEAQRMAKEAGLKCVVFDKKEIEKRGMKLLAAVGQGSVHEPRFIHISYVPKKPKKKLVFVGKGLTFDSGGLCIKPAPGMGEMKSDMSGAGNVVGLMAAVAALKPQIEVHGIIASAENMPDGNAYRPGDVFGSLDGKTVEIINTDAEGRLVLADALAYARTLEPDVLLDNATLTGACVVALGKTCSGFFATTDRLASQFATAAKDAGELFWRLPLLDDLKEQLRSDIADLKHTGDRWGGSITAALFLKEFVGNLPYIHLDIAGPSLADRAHGFYPKGGTGHGVLTFLSFIEHFGAK
ncbi:MAG: leucyl aminopeptidase [Polyangiaceae bacterium]